MKLIMNDKSIYTIIYIEIFATLLKLTCIKMLTIIIVYVIFIKEQRRSLIFKKALSMLSLLLVSVFFI